MVGLNATKEDANSGSIKCLSDFFSNGVDLTDSGWKIRSEIDGFIDEEIPGYVIERIRTFVGPIIIKESRENCVKFAKQIANPISSYKAWGEPLIFPIKEPEVSKVFPGELYGHIIRGKNVAECWVRILHLIRKTGVVRPTSHDSQWQELIDLMTVVTDEGTDLDSFYFPEPNYLSCDREFVKSYIPQVLEDSQYREGVKYTYGQRLRSWFGADQIEEAIAKLIREPDSASCVMSLWDGGGNSFGRGDSSSDHQHGGSPCLNHIWLRVNNGLLSMTAIFRSNDMFSAWPANAFGLRSLQTHIIKTYNSRVESTDTINSNYHFSSSINQERPHSLKFGPLITISQSAHIYDDCWHFVDNLIENQHGKIVKKKRYNDPVGNFIIEKEGDRFIATLTCPKSGKQIVKYSSSSPQMILDNIIVNHPEIQPSHAAYLGKEIGKCL
ncbi:MAG: thymidylate synthase [Okeania sp. SIO2H7]|nr:thymidylate synthase [Okeania sp. SIO2H7]